jgi:uncharacterized protein
MPYPTLPELASLSLHQIAELSAARKLPPVHEWNPAQSGDSEMIIMSDGRWFHQGGEIKRPAMIRAFSSLLRRDGDGGYFLVTPAEKLSIIIEDAPFIAVELRHEGSGKSRNIAMRLNTDDLVILGANHRMEMRKQEGQDVPYIHVRDNLWAKVARPVYYELAELALADDNEHPVIWSNGTAFPLEAIA